MEPVRVFVGTDRSQLLAVKVLEHSIKRHTKLPVELTPMCDLPIRMPKDPRQGQRTGFSFSRFCIPKLAGYKGRAVYMDADMLVMKDIRELWEMPFDGAKVIIQEELSKDQSVKTTQKTGAPKKRIKQCAVMLLDCDSLRWEIDSIIDGLDQGKYTYESLMYDLSLLDESEVSYALPFRWNSLEHLDPTTSLIHYTDMGTQPWVSPFNKNAEVWFDEVRLMIKTGALTMDEIRREVELGYFRPSLIRELQYGRLVPKIFKSAFNAFNFSSDKAAGYKPHAEVFKAKRERDKLIKDYEAQSRVGHAT